MSESRPAVAPAKPSATVMLTRDGEHGVEVFMLERHSRADFGGAHVFPGGIAGDDDYAEKLEPFCSGLDDAIASDLLGVKAGGLALWVTAIRECFEESGYLLARDQHGVLAQPGASDCEQRFAEYRRALCENRMSMLEFCQAESLVMMCDALHYVAYWTTPEALPRRYATRFFAAGVPAGQVGLHDGHEAVDSLWVNAGEATDRAIEPRLTLHPPTSVNLRWLAEFDNVEQLLSAAEKMDTSQIQHIMPVMEMTERGPRAKIPKRGES